MDIQRVVFLGFVVAFASVGVAIAVQLLRYAFQRLNVPVSLRR